MKLVTFDAGSGSRLGAIVGNDGVLDLEESGRLHGRSLPSAMQPFIEAGEKAWDDARWLIERSPSEAMRRNFRLRAPLPQPIRVRDCNLFLEHMEVSLKKIAKLARERGEVPVLDGLAPVYKQQCIYYNADHVHIYGPNDDIPWPAHSDWIDYELEWACVIGKTAIDIRSDQAREHIFGFTIFNDWSARDLQFPFMTAGLGPGEGKDFANSLGPCIATLDEFDDPYACSMTARVNGELWSSGSTSTMYHKFESAIAQFSKSKMLFAGEVLGSGTVLGGCGFELGRRLSRGDLVELSIDNIGTLRNRIGGRQDGPASTPKLWRIAQVTSSQ